MIMYLSNIFLDLQRASVKRVTLSTIYHRKGFSLIQYQEGFTTGVVDTADRLNQLGVFETRLVSARPAAEQILLW